MAFNRIILLLLLTLTPLFFTKPQIHLTLLEKRLWDLGHIPFFMLLTYAFLPYFKQKIKRTQRPFNVIFALFIFVFFLAAGIEALQIMFGRDASLSDLRKDMLGVMFVCQTYLLLKVTSNKIWRVSFLFTFLWLLMELYPSSEAALDRWRMLQSIPSLANFETKTELLRWSEGNYERHLSETLTFSDDVDKSLNETTNHVLKISLNTHHYTGIVGNGLFQDWSKYRALQFDIYNPNDYVLYLNIKVEDALSMGEGMSYHNRYNGIQKLYSGANRIKISFDEIVNGPQGRRMELTEIRRLSLFFSKLSEESFIYLDNVTLISR